MRRDALVVIGNFDGVHRGHQALLAAVCRRSKQDGLWPKVLTFDPHPAVALGRPAPALLSTTDRRIELLARACPGVEVVVQAFDAAFASQSPAEFVERVLLARLQAALVVVGDNFRFGAGRAGGIEELRAFGDEHGFETLVEPLASDEGGAWSSTRIRGCIAAGEVAEAATMLGRPHMVSGTVVAGDRRGRQLGFPTCNLGDPPEALPGHGVYAVLVDRVEQGEARALARGVANVGLRPTVASSERALVEVHLFDFTGDLYGAELRVHLVERLRAEKRFDGLEALRAQIDRDSQQARELLADREPAAPGGAWA